MLKRVSYPPHVFNGISPLMRDFKEGSPLRIFGGDTETFKGAPLTIQVCGPTGPEDECSPTSAATTSS